jgi:autotransporter-associated beta strand protein
MVKHWSLHYRHRSSPQSKSNIRAEKETPMTNTFWNGTSDDWSNAANWSPGLPNSKRDAIINADGTYTVTISSADTARSLTIDNAGATLSENSSGGLTMRGGLTLDSGTVILNSANSFGGETTLVGGLLELGNVAALGKSDLIIDGGALVGTANETLFNRITASGVFTLAAAHGDTVRLTSGAIFNMDAGGTIQFGQTGDDGIFVWDPVTLSVADSGPGFAVVVNAGTLRDVNGSLNDVLSAANATTIAAGATLDTHGFAETILALQGSGAVTSTLSGSVVTVEGGDFSGVVSGPIALQVSGQLLNHGTLSPNGGTTIENLAALTLTGSGTFTKPVTINSGGTLSLQGTATLALPITDDGTIVVGQDNVVSVPDVSEEIKSPISGAGKLIVYGLDDLDEGTITLGGHNTYSGGTLIQYGVVKIGNARALGTGALQIATSELIGTATEALANPITMQGAPFGNQVTFAATTGTTLTLNSGAAWTIDSTRANLVFGVGAYRGTVVWDSPAGSADTAGPVQLTIAVGTLRAGDSGFQTLLDACANGVKIEPLATLDVAGFACTIHNIIDNDGTLENSGAATTVTLTSGEYGGQIKGPITLAIDSASGVRLHGSAADWKDIDILPDSTLTLLSVCSGTVNEIASGGKLILQFPYEFTGKVGGIQSGAVIEFGEMPKTGTTVDYVGNASGGTLTVSHSTTSYSIHLVGNYTSGIFSISGGSSSVVDVEYTVPPPSTFAAASAKPDTFDFSNASVPSPPTDMNVEELRSRHSHGTLFTHDATEILHTHDLPLGHFVHDLFAHHAMPEALG